MNRDHQYPETRSTASGVEEIQGLYGAYSFPEKLLQKIWFRGDFDRSTLVTHDGRKVQVRHPGRWNLLGGPDFKDARLRFDAGPEITGDVELHLRADDWAAHRHARDRAYDRVILHVVLFPTDAAHVTRAGDGRNLPVLALLPHLYHDLEQFAAEEAVEAMANRPSSRILAELGVLAGDQLASLLQRHAMRRWQQKVRIARLRVQRLGWAAACHHAALEILGYRFNRTPMLRIAAAWPLELWTKGEVDSDAVTAGEIWSLQGARPANHPRIRLRQYAAWARTTADWPARLRASGAEFPIVSLELPAGKVRRWHHLAGVRGRMSRDACAAVVRGTRFDNLVCDGFLPLVSAESGRDLGALWYHWFPGDLPPRFTQVLCTLGVFNGRASPAAHGPAQGLLGWLIENETTTLTGGTA